MNKKRILFIGDGVVPTGFSTVTHNIISNLDPREYEVHHLAVNYFGDPHPFGWNIYPAYTLGGDIMGYKKLAKFADIKFDGIFILNDVWVINQYLKVIKSVFTVIPRIIVYFPIDSKDLDPRWFEEFDVVSQVVVYTQFGYDEVKKVYDGDNISIIGHGTDITKFRRLGLTRDKVKQELFNNHENSDDTFIVLNAN